MKITIDHPASSHGIPVILDNDGSVLDTATGIKRARKTLGLSTGELAEAIGCSPRTIENWEQGRPASAAGLNVLMRLLETDA